MDEFMKDRYGVDDLTTVMGIAGMVVCVIGSLASWRVLMWLGLIVVVLAVVRALSKNIDARSRENDKWHELTAKLPISGKGGSGRTAAAGGDFKRQARTAQKMWKDRKVKAFLKCPTCGTTLAVPKGKGKLIVTCPKCKTRMETRS